eukprot:TRINITY_DN5729_c0_g1_i1.p1 TRINITY_DN5729_c0_g1~~TRINITY_DN5729_c0_g1_i1.p1  ORF type:complete len:178 (+),score=19.69 TRINITY_DN5729_c0_g1_i1:169-702(+)
MEGKCKAKGKESHPLIGKKLQVSSCNNNQTSPPNVTYPSPSTGLKHSSSMPNLFSAIMKSSPKAASVPTTTETTAIKSELQLSHAWLDEVSTLSPMLPDCDCDALQTLIQPLKHDCSSLILANDTISAENSNPDRLKQGTFHQLVKWLVLHLGKSFFFAASPLKKMGFIDVFALSYQ